MNAGSVADELDAVAEAKAYIESLPKVDLNEYELRKLRHDVEADVRLLKSLYERTGRLPKRRQTGKTQGTPGGRSEGQEGPDFQLLQGHDPLPFPGLTADVKRGMATRGGRAGHPPD